MKDPAEFLRHSSLRQPAGRGWNVFRFAIVLLLASSPALASGLAELQSSSGCNFYPIGWQRSVVEGRKTAEDCVNRCRSGGFTQGCSSAICQRMCDTQWGPSDLRADDRRAGLTVPVMDPADRAQLPYPAGAKVTIKGLDIGRYLSICKNCQHMKGSKGEYSGTFHMDGDARSAETFTVEHYQGKTALRAFNGYYLALCNDCKSRERRAVIIGIKPPPGKPLPDEALFDFFYVAPSVFNVVSSNGRYWTRYHNHIDLEGSGRNIKSQILSSYYAKNDRAAGRFEIRWLGRPVPPPRSSSQQIPVVSLAKVENCSGGYVGKSCSSNAECGPRLSCEDLGADVLAQFLGGFAAGEKFCLAKDVDRLQKAMEDQDFETLGEVPLCSSQNDLAEAAKTRKATFVFGFGTAISGGAKISAEFGATFGAGGEVGYYATNCSGLETNLSAEAYATVGLYRGWSALPGSSFVAGSNVATPAARVSYSSAAVWSFPDELPIGTQASFGLGTGFLPFAASAEWCSTSVFQLLPELRFYQGPKSRNTRESEADRRARCQREHPQDTLKRRICRGETIGPRAL